MVMRSVPVGLSTDSVVIVQIACGRVEPNLRFLQMHTITLASTGNFHLRHIGGRDRGDFARPRFKARSAETCIRVIRSAAGLLQNYQASHKVGRQVGRGRMNLPIFVSSFLG